MKRSSEPALSRRERQIMNALFALGTATGHEIQAKLEDAPSYSSVRTILRILEGKGFITHKEEAGRYVYEPVVAKEAARESALQHILHTFFEGSAQRAVVALLDPQSFRLSKDELDELSDLIKKAKEKHR
jgi:BlaI family transcriptional regulator, penicillinase repressor